MKIAIQISDGKPCPYEEEEKRYESEFPPTEEKNGFGNLLLQERKVGNRSHIRLMSLMNKLTSMLSESLHTPILLLILMYYDIMKKLKQLV